MTFLGSVQTHIFHDLGSSPGFSGQFPKHFAALPRKNKNAASLGPQKKEKSGPSFALCFCSQRVVSTENILQSSHATLHVKFCGHVNTPKDIVGVESPG